MVATTFAADTPLAVTELVATNGISGNWLWWNMLVGGMLTTFFFARYWRRANVLTDVEFIHVRYSGAPARFLRLFKSVYMGVFLNSLVIGWVNLALISLLEVFFDLSRTSSLWVTGLAILVVMGYSAISGLLGIVYTDVLQFLTAIAGSFILAFVVLDVPEVGGIAGLKAALPESTFSFLPVIGSDQSATSALVLGLGSFLAYTTIQWWASWYPGNEPGGGGYIAQRMMSAKDEKNAVYSSFLFQIAHYCLRSWPWVIVAVATLVLYPNLTDKRLGYVMAMKDFLPEGVKGLLLVSFLAAYMSTISTQLNWGASYLINDLYRVLKPSAKQKSLVMASRIATILLAGIGLFVTTRIETISSVWQFLMECGAGLGLVLILRWYWWRVNAWSEITASIAPFVGYAIARYVLAWVFPDSFFFIVSFTTVCWILVTYLTPTNDMETLRGFYDRVKPAGNWRVFSSDMQSYVLLYSLICWLAGCGLAYSAMFLIGGIIFNMPNTWQYGVGLAVSLGIFAVFFPRWLKHTNS